MSNEEIGMLIVFLAGYVIYMGFASLLSWIDETYGDTFTEKDKFNLDVAMIGSMIIASIAMLGTMFILGPITGIVLPFGIFIGISLLFRFVRYVWRNV